MEDSDNKKRLIAVGDIHGDLDKLEALLRSVQPTSADQFVFLGDYEGKGSGRKRR